MSGGVWRGRDPEICGQRLTGVTFTITGHRADDAPALGCCARCRSWRPLRKGAYCSSSCRAKATKETASHAV